MPFSLTPSATVAVNISSGTGRYITDMTGSFPTMRTSWVPNMGIPLP